MASASQNNTQNIINVEKQTKQSIKNINVDLSKLDMSTAIDSFKRLEAIAAAADFSAFFDQLVALKKSFTAFQSAVRSAGTETEKFIGLPKDIRGVQIAQDVEVNNNVDNSIRVDLSNLGGALEALNGPIAAVGQSFTALGGAAQAFGSGIASAAGGAAGLVDSVTSLLSGMGDLGAGLTGAAAGVSLLVPLLPQLGTSILTMAVNMAGVLAYLPELLVFLVVVTALSLLGEGLMAAGTGLVNIGLGLTSMSAGMASLLEFMPVFLSSLAGITENVGGIVLFVLLAASMLVMAIALQIMNEQMTTFVENMRELSGLMSAGFVAGFVVFGAVLIAMSLFLSKVASGMEKVTGSMEKQAGKLAVLNPLLAAQAILTNPIVGAITVAAAVTGGMLVQSLLPAMATGGVVTAPTVAMVGEGRYPEAVVPLGDSPQFSAMKTDIANAVVQAVRLSRPAAGGGEKGETNVTLNIDGQAFARLIMPKLRKEGYRRGFDIAAKGV